MITTVDLKPFVITETTILANSGGKTSGYNLWLHLQANGGVLPDRCRCVFTNTGWEHPLTLDFLAEQSRRWSVDIVWLEFCRRPATVEELCRLEIKWQRAQDRLARFNAEPLSFFVPKRARKGEVALLIPISPQERKTKALARANNYAQSCYWAWRKAGLIGMNTYRRVDRGTASLRGEPYEELLGGLARYRKLKGEPPVLPNGVQRICTGRLKMGTSAQFARDTWGVGPSRYEARLGLRADEEERITSAFASKSKEAGRPRFPLDEAGIVKKDVMAFWAEQSFTMTLKAHEGNCAGCFMKRRAALVDLIRRKFFDLDWWKDWEARSGQRFRQERSFRGLEVAARTELDLLPPEDGDNGISCESGYCSN